MGLCRLRNDALSASPSSRYAEGYRFASSAVNLSTSMISRLQGKGLSADAAVNAPWTQPLDVTIELSQAAFRAGTETGDLFYACHAWVSIASRHDLLQGAPLDAVWRESEKGLAFARKVKYQDGVDVIVSQQRFIASHAGPDRTLVLLRRRTGRTGRVRREHVRRGGVRGEPGRGQDSRRWFAGTGSSRCRRASCRATMWRPSRRPEEQRRCCGLWSAILHTVA